MAMHSSILSWRIPWTENPGELQSMGPKKSDMTEQLFFHFRLNNLGKSYGYASNDGQ